MPQVNSPHPVAQRRIARGWTQGELAIRSSLPRTTLSAIEGGRLTPSVSAALAVGRALDCSVEELFGVGAGVTGDISRWAWQPLTEPCRYWEADVSGQRLIYPVEALPGSAWAHDGISRNGVLHERSRREAAQTLVLAGCDPAAGLLAAEYTAASGFRLLTFLRGGGAALDLLKLGVVHVAALHRSTAELPLRNAATVRQRLGDGCRLLRCADWQEGIVLPPQDHTRSVNTCVRSVRQWAVREPGSAARECLEELLTKPLTARRTISSHAAVAEAVRGGWAQAGVCVQLVAEEAGLRFLPVRTESLDLCFPASLERDPRVQALVRLLRSRAHRRLIDELPGYDARHTGQLMST